MVENDGFEKGEGRLPIEENDLPTVKHEIELFKRFWETKSQSMILQENLQVK